MKVLLPTSVQLNPELPAGVSAVSYDPTQSIPEEHLDAEVLVAWLNRGRNLRDAATLMPRLRLVQGLMAGTDYLTKFDFAPEVKICSGVGLHNSTVAEHGLAMILALVRNLPGTLAAQAERRWDPALAGNQAFAGPGRITTLNRARVTIWGFGSIGQHLAPMLSALGADVLGVARTAGQRAGYPVIAEDSLAAELGRTDVLVMVLPGIEANQNALNSARIAQLKPGAIVVNVGRGNTVDESALLAGLASGQLGAAGLDVMQTEPLPVDSPLWQVPNLLLTPHVAGNRPIGADELIVANIDALRSGGQLRNLVER